MDPRVAGPLSENETALLEEGLHRFDTGQFWHAHESWEDLWNSLKRRNAQSGDPSGSRVDSNGGHVAASPTKKRRGRLQAVGKIATQTRGMGRRMGIGCSHASPGH